MVIQQIIGNIADSAFAEKETDYLTLEWFETTKRIFRKHSLQGRELAAKFLAQQHQLCDGDILLEEEKFRVVVQILPCDCLIIVPQNHIELANACYEIGNKHLPLFLHNNELLMPYDAPLHRLLQVQGYRVSKQNRQLLHPLKTTVAPHGADSSGTSLFSKILKLTANSD